MLSEFSFFFFLQAGFQTFYTELNWTPWPYFRIRWGYILIFYHNTIGFGFHKFLESATHVRKS